MSQGALSQQQFKHARPLGGPNGVEAQLRARADYEQRTGWRDPKGEGAAMALLNDPTDPHRQGFTPAHWSEGGSREGYWHRGSRK